MYDWKSQIGEGRFALQVESDNMEQGKQTERAVQAILDGQEPVTVVHCKDCVYGMAFRRKSPKCEHLMICTKPWHTVCPADFCSWGHEGYEGK